MFRPSTTPRSRARAIRIVAVLLLIAQAMMGVATAYEPPVNGAAPVMHVESKGAQHADMQHSDHCVVCTARHVLATRPSPETPAFVPAHEFIPATGAAKSATPADPRAGNPSRAPPTAV